MSNLNSISYFVPELFLIATILVLIIVDLFLKQEKKVITAYLAAAGVLVTVWLTWQQLQMPATSLFMGMIVLDSFAVYFKLLAGISTLIVIFISLPMFREKSEYFVLLLVVTLGMFLMAQVNNILMILIAMELVGIISYILAGFNKKDLKSNEAALKYVIYGAVSTGVMAFGFSYIYGITGATNLFDIQQALLNGAQNPLTMLIAVVMVLAGLGYKIAMVPFHFWVPDVYEGAPTPVTAFLSVGPKAAGLALFIRFIITAVAHPADSSMSAFIQNVNIQAPLLLATLAVLTMTVGNLSALNQKNIKRMLGYSALAHVGYMVMAMVVLNEAGFSAIMFYMLIYMFMNFGAFWVAESMHKKLGGDEIKLYKGLAYKDPLTAVAMAVFMFSLTGLPPFAGFIGKVYLFAAVIKDGWYILATLGVINSVISLYYYAYVVKVMFLEKEEEPVPLPSSLYHKILLLVLFVPTMILGLYWTPVIDFATQSFHIFLGH